jgi:hypothetical protein
MRLKFVTLAMLAAIFSGCTNTNPPATTASNVAATPSTAAIGNIQQVKGLMESLEKA